MSSTTTTSERPTVCDCGHPPRYVLGHAYNPIPGTVDVAAPASTWLCRCGETYTAHGVGTGYGRDSDDRTHCYDCCEEQERSGILAAKPGDRWFAYLAADCRTVKSWTGATLLRVVRCWQTREGFGGAVRIWARDTAGGWWGGRGPRDSGTYVRLRRLKREPR